MRTIAVILGVILVSVLLMGSSVIADVPAQHNDAGIAQMQSSPPIDAVYAAPASVTCIVQNLGEIKDFNPAIQSYKNTTDFQSNTKILDFQQVKNIDFNQIEKVSMTDQQVFFQRIQYSAHGEILRPPNRSIMINPKTSFIYLC